VRATVSTTALGILAGSLAVLVAFAGLLLVRRLTALNLREEHNEVAGFIYAALAVAYAVVLGFVLITVWERYEAARVTADQEGSELAAVYWLANQLPNSDRRQVQELARSYAQVVIDEEWPMMQDGLSSPRAWVLMDQLRQSLQDFEPSTSAEEEVYAQGLSRVHDLTEARRLRLLDANTGIPTILWVVLLAGGVITVSFTYLFGLKNTWVHTVMVVALTVVLTSILFTIYTLENPFAGDSRISPEAFELDLQGFEGSIGNDSKAT
jgi:hypothetical protein